MFLHMRRVSAYQRLNDVTGDVRQAKIPALEAIGQLGMFNAHLMKHGGM